jgi:hypothetical protein
MADRKGKSSRKKRTRRFPGSQFKGKIVQNVEVDTTDYGCSIGIMFQDRTYLCFEVEIGGVMILPDLSDWKTGNYKPLKRWKAISS